ncbi:MAG TPA: hypothetical protein VFK36_12280 [Gemmatimonadales bacterium]|nr:hypothetical protein [Gemmatimonadales bacterium]
MNTTPGWFKVVAVVALLWNLLGCFAFATDLSMSPEDIARMSPSQQELYDARPGWALAATGLAVIAGALGSIGLLLRKKWAVPLFLLSLIGIIAQDFGLFVLAGGATRAGPVPLVLQTLVLAFAVWLLLLSRKGVARGWLT